MTYKQIEASREVRLWVTQVIVPAVGLAVGTVMLNPELKEKAMNKFEEFKNRVKYKAYR